MKLKRETKGHAPSAQLLRLMSWTIFITPIPKEVASFEQLLDIYGLHPQFARLARYCTYDKRLNRENFNEKWQRWSEAWA